MKNSVFFNWPVFLPRLAVFIIIAVIISLPIQALTYYSELRQKKDQLADYGLEAMDSWQRGVRAGRAELFPIAENEFQKAYANFEEIDKGIREVNKFLLAAGQVASQDLRAGQNLAQAGQIISGLAQSMAETMAWWEKEGRPMSERIEELYQALRNNSENFEKALDLLSAVDPKSLPAGYRQSFTQLALVLPLLEKQIEEAVDLTETTRQIMGFDGYRRYLIIFQNNSELRATGGFIGSFALLDIYQGKVQNFEAPGGGSYDLQGYSEARLIAPPPLHIVNARWEFQDANWWPDFPTSAEKIIWFYEKAGGPTVDGVISLTPTVIERLLPVMGPLELPEENLVINEDNFYEIVQRESEQKPWETLQPKKIIGALSAAMIERIMNLEPEKYLEIMNVLDQLLSEKQILFYFTERAWDLQKKIQDYGWAGEIKSAVKDYLMVVNTNIRGAKTDRVIEEQRNLEVNISEDGIITNVLTITRRHNGLSGEEFFGTRNHNYLRVYVPAGSQLISTYGFKQPPDELKEAIADDLKFDDDWLRLEGEMKRDPESQTYIYEQFGKTVFANWLYQDPGETASVRLEYILPFRISINAGQEDLKSWLAENLLNLEQKSVYYYSLLEQKQPGAPAADVDITINWPAAWSEAWSCDQEALAVGNEMKYEEKFDSDRVYCLIFERS